MDHIRFSILALLWGSNFMLMKKASAAFGPLTIASGRMLGGALVLVGIWRLITRDAWPIAKRDIGPFLAIVIVGYVVPYSVLTALIGRYGQSGFFGMSVALVPLLTILMSIPMLGKRPTKRQLIGVIGGLACVPLLMRDGAANRDIPLWGILAAITVPTCYAIVNTYIKRRFPKAAPLPFAMICLAVAGVLLAPVGLAREPILHQHESFMTASAALIWFGVMGTGVSVMLFYTLLLKRGPLFAGMVAYIVPLVAIVWGALDGEQLTMEQMIAFVLLLAMVALVQSERGLEAVGGKTEMAADELSGDLAEETGEPMTTASKA